MTEVCVVVVARTLFAQWRVGVRPAGGAATFAYWNNATVDRPGRARDGEYAYGPCAAMMLPFEGAWAAHSCAPYDYNMMLMMAPSCGGCVCEYGADSSPRLYRLR